MSKLQNQYARQHGMEKDSETGLLIPSGERAPDVNGRVKGYSLLTQLIVGAVVAAVVSFVYAPPKSPEYIYAIAYVIAGGLLVIAGGLLALVVLTSAWFWVVASAIAAVALACTALACTIHFMIWQAVLAVFATMVAIVLLRVSVGRLLL